MPQEFYTDGTPSRTEIDDADGELTRFADDATIAELERLARRNAELEAALRVFAAFGAALNKLSGPSPKSGDWYTIQAGDAPVTLRFEDFAAATRAMET